MELLDFAQKAIPYINNPWDFAAFLLALGLVAYQAFLKSKEKTNSTENKIDNKGAKIKNQYNSCDIKNETHY